MKVVVIGAGPAGETAARFLAKRKASVCLIEKEHLGGLCLNRGCIPSKTLLSFGKKLFDLRHSPVFKQVPPFNNGTIHQEFWQEIKNQKNLIIERLRDNIAKTLKMHGVEVIQGKAEFSAPQEIIVKNSTNTERLAFDSAIIAVGSKAVVPPPLDTFEQELLNSDRILDLDRIPKNLAVIGGGAIGCEFACLFRELGSEVFLIEKMPNLLPGEDVQIVNYLRKSFEKRGIKVYSSTTVTAIKSPISLPSPLAREGQGEGQWWELTLSTGEKITVEKVLTAVGRKPNVHALNLDKAGVQYSTQGITIDERLRTTNPNVFAVGDVNGLSLLAHAGSTQGEIAAENALGGQRTYDGSLVPRCLYTWPEVASVGLWKEQAEAQGIQVATQRFFFEASGRALADHDAEGFIQILSDKNSDQIIGAQIIGPHATEIIHVLSVALYRKMTRHELKQVIFAHPTLSEGIQAALNR